MARMTREQLLAASDIKHPCESRWAEHQRGEARLSTLTRHMASVLTRTAQRGHAARSSTNTRRRRSAASSSTSSPDPGEPSEPEPTCLGCGRSVAHRRKGAKWCEGKRGERCRKSLQRAEQRLKRDRPRQLPTSWAEEERAERDAWRALGDPDRPRRIFRARLITHYDVDPEVLEVFREEEHRGVFVVGEVVA